MTNVSCQCQIKRPEPEVKVGAVRKKPEVKVGAVKSKKREGEWGKDTHTGSEIQNSLFFKENLLRPKNYNVTELGTHTHTYTQEVKLKILFF